MRHVRTIAFLIAALLVLGAVRAEGEALFASPPHFLSLRDREQIVFFINEPVVGALASRTSPDTIEIVVPRAIVDPTLRAMTFRADENDAVAGTRVALAPAPRGNAAIKIITGEPPGGVHAYSESDPPRLIVDLLAAAPQPTVTPIRKPAAAATRAHAAPTAKPSPVATAAPGATLKPTAAKPTAVAATAALPSARPPSPRPTPLAERGPTVPRPQATAPESLGALRSTVAVATRTDTAASDAFPCAWRRVAGVPFCAPDPGAPPYATRRELAALASALAGDTAPASLPDAPDDDEPAALYLAADRELVARARSGRLLPAIDLYRRALRRAPRFFDAPRARLNVALTYRTLGFDAELQSVAREAAGDPTRPLLDALVGDVARERGAVDRARDAYARADTNGVAACLATRGRAALALDTDPPASAADDVARLPDLCPPALLADPETMLVQARQQLAAGDAHRSLTMLEAIRQAPGAGQEGAVVDGIAAAADAAGDTTRARAAYADLASGRFGGRFATRGTIGLARLDAAAGDVQGGFRRLGALAPDTAAPQRQRFAQDALSRALAHADHADAVAIVADQGIAPAALSTDDQILLARSYRVVGLGDARP